MQEIAIEQLPADSDHPVIRVGATVIAEETVAREMQYYSAATPEEAFRQAARALAIRELLTLRADELGLAHDPDNEQARLTQLLEHELDTPEPDEAACRRFFAAHPERFRTPTRLDVRHILLAAAPDDSAARDAQRRLGETLLVELADHPERFDELAMRHSACPSREDGGRLGWLAPGQTVEELDNALRHLPEGLHNRPLASRYGWHIVAIDRRIDGQPLPFERVAGRVHHTLREQASRRALRHYLLALANQYGVEGVALETDGALMQ
ncbi:peptidylprolyl isomerase [Salinicola sp. LHM]|uniref:peptidylprolyl isomerase n=1 Tax=unclassified Salinicola TaxID=2634022 RepID=UPI0008DD2A8B|nr:MULTISPECIES: peptidylprolyl isomerase [unclassified Salinicola]MEC8917617.1 peptidylprolyl isomerase [Pseudomonadota bacterium]MED5501545.1 peptidylprolyl isomerase [Pseudomonadota bacterium]OHZ02925.1 peptidylprolyl isomerase [Salinicola sp. MIT1003]WQH32858.1 peptidylprolyl isomerase [Salinicola sp. LHM]